MAIGSGRMLSMRVLVYCSKMLALPPRNGQRIKNQFLYYKCPKLFGKGPHSKPDVNKFSPLED